MVNNYLLLKCNHGVGEPKLKKEISENFKCKFGIRIYKLI